MHVALCDSAEWRCASAASGASCLLLLPRLVRPGGILLEGGGFVNKGAVGFQQSAISSIGAREGFTVEAAKRAQRPLSGRESVGLIHASKQKTRLR